MTEAKVSGPTKFRRCFVTGSSGPALHAVAQMLETRGIDVISADRLNAGSVITQEILRLIASSDFLAAVLDEGDRSSAIYEMGVARGLGKPAFVVVTGGGFGPGLSGVYVRAVESPDRVGDAADDLDRFLRNAKRPAPIERTPHEERPVALGWAKEALAQIRAEKTGHRGLHLEQLVEKIFDAAGAEVLATGAGRDEGVDFVVWLDQVAGQTGGPLLVECKLFQGGSGSVIKNSEALMRRLARTVEGTNSGLALLVYDHDRPHTPPSLHETPQVLSFAVEDLIEKLEHGALAQELLRRRERAAFASRRRG